MASLFVTSGSRQGQSVGVTGELVIGRADAGLTIDDAEVSRRHAVVRQLESGQLQIEDLGSANGTFVNGSRIDGPVTIGGGTKIRVGRTEFEVRGVAPVETHDATRLAASPLADPQATRAAPTGGPELTRARPLPDLQIPAGAPIADPQTTKARAIPRPEVTKARGVPADLAAPQPSARSVLDTAPPVAPAPGAPAPGSSKRTAAQVGAFSPPARRRGHGLASRSWVPTVASFGTAIAAAAALIVYFAIHGVPG